MSETAAPTPAATPPADPPQTDPPATPPAAATPPASDPPAVPPAGQPKLEDLPPDVQRLIENQRRSEREALKRAEAAEEKVTAAEREKLSEKERAEAEAKDAREAAEKARREANEARLQVQLSRAEIKRTVKDADGEDKEITVRVADPELAADYLLKQGVEFNDDGTVKDFEDRVSRALAERPILAATPGETPAPQGEMPAPPRANGGAGGGTGETPPTLTAEQVEAANKAGKTPEEWAALSSAKTFEDFEKARAVAKSD